MEKYNQLKLFVHIEAGDPILPSSFHCYMVCFQAMGEAEGYAEQIEKVKDHELNRELKEQNEETPTHRALELDNPALGGRLLICFFMFMNNNNLSKAFLTLDFHITSFLFSIS